MILYSRLPKGEKEKPKSKRKVEKIVKDVDEEIVTDLKEIGQHNYDILIRKLSGNLARKI